MKPLQPLHKSKNILCTNSSLIFHYSDFWIFRRKKHHKSINLEMICLFGFSSAKGWAVRTQTKQFRNCIKYCECSFNWQFGVGAKRQVVYNCYLDPLAVCQEALWSLIPSPNPWRPQLLSSVWRCFPLLDCFGVAPTKISPRMPSNCLSLVLFLLMKSACFIVLATQEAKNGNKPEPSTWFPPSITFTPPVHCSCPSVLRVPFRALSEQVI